LLSTPLTACLVVLGRHLRHLEFLDVLLGNEPVLTPEETFYQRLLADDSDDATEQAEEFARERSFAEFFDEIAIPALVRMQADRDRGAISAERCVKVRQCIKAMLENLFDGTIEEAAPIAEYPARPEVGPMPAIYCIAGRNNIDAAAALVLAYLPRLEGRVRSHQVRFANLPLSDVVYPRPFEEAGPGFCVPNQDECARTGSLSRAAHSTARAGRESFGRPVGIVTGRARRRESGAWRLGRYRHERTRCSCQGARSCQQIRQ
jgi:hypothetical protein